MRTTALLLACAAALSGCALNMRLLEDGKVHQGKFSPATRSMSAEIDGDHYEGPISQGMGVGFGTAFSGRRTAFGTSVGTTGDWSGILTSKTGRVIQCSFNAALGAGSGMCEALDGRRHALVVGAMPGDPPP